MTRTFSLDYKVPTFSELTICLIPFLRGLSMHPNRQQLTNWEFLARLFLTFGVYIINSLPGWLPPPRTATVLPPVLISFVWGSTFCPLLFLQWAIPQLEQSESTPSPSELRSVPSECWSTCELDCRQQLIPWVRPSQRGTVHLGLSFFPDFCWPLVIDTGAMITSRFFTGRQPIPQGSLTL